MTTPKKKVGPKKGGWASTLTEAKKNAIMDVTAPSGSRYTLRAMTLDDLAAVEGLPREILYATLQEMTPGGVVAEISEKLRQGDAETLEEARALSQHLAGVRDRLVLHAVISPQLQLADVEALDTFDRSFIAEIAQRKRVVDAEGKQVGADPLATFRASSQEQ